jgi:NADH-quinone oxidoreductase subunit J
VTPVPASATTVPDLVTFVICAAVVLSGGIGVVTSRNAVHAALSLVATLFGVAVLFIEQDAQFLAAVQIIVYAGAIVVLFLFVIMFLGVDRLEDIEKDPLKGQRPLALVLTGVSLAGVLSLAATAHWVTGARHVAGSTTAGGHTNTYLLGKSIFTTYLWAFEVTAGLLVIAVVGAVVLARRPTDVHDALEDPGSVGPWSEPGATAAGPPAEGGPGPDGGPEPSGGPGGGKEPEGAMGGAVEPAGVGLRAGSGGGTPGSEVGR